ncbi:Bromodomain and WD repeat-containing protein 1 [Phytophthora cinnamomi]|uniref:Bromodomain and WD repeat-containing protein 1 n=1 Tax=Phytophthora cinnamomi TaxID=4785 RepID=UPI00355959C8|nr:Bromodomain and WD repeat-containing protein 1 [Phytophthora cinnamomi]
MDDDPSRRSPEHDARDAAAAAAGGNGPDALRLADAREALPAIAAVESDGHVRVQPVEEHKSEEQTPQEQEQEQEQQQQRDEQQEQQQQQQGQVDESEVYFLIADFLKRRSACHRAADALIQELAEHRLLRGGVDWAGRPKTATYEDYRLRHRDISSAHLVQLLQGAAASFPRLNAKKEVDDKVKDAPAEGNSSLLLKARVSRQLKLQPEERKKLAKDIVQQLFALRGVLKTLKVVEKVIRKYERYQQYTTASRVEDLPRELQLMMLGGEPAAKTESDAETDKVTTLAADVRALKQLFQLRQERAVVEKQIEALMDRAKRSGLFQTTVRTGRNQASLLRRREISSRHDTQLPPAYVYSRIRRLKTLSGHLQIQAYCLAYDKQGKVVITGSDDRLVKIWSLRTGDLLFTLRGHVGNITDLVVNHSNTLLASSSDDKTVRVWELSTGAPVAVLVGHSSVVNAVRFHPKNNIIVTASDDGRCFCYKVPEIPLMDKPETKIETARRLYALKAYMLSLHPIYAMKHARREGPQTPQL